MENKVYKWKLRGNFLQRIWSRWYPQTYYTKSNYLYASFAEAEEKIYAWIQELAQKGVGLFEYSFTSSLQLNKEGQPTDYEDKLNNKFFFEITYKTNKIKFLPLPKWRMGNAINHLPIEKGHIKRFVNRVDKHYNVINGQGIVGDCCLRLLDEVTN